MIDWNALRRPSLARKFIVLTSTMILMTALLLLFFGLTRGRKYSHQGLLEHGRAVAAIMALNSEYGIYTEDRATLDQLVDSMASGPDVIYAAVLNRRGQPLAEANRSSSWTAPPPVLPVDPAGPPAHRDGTLAEDGSPAIDIVAAVVSPTEGNVDIDGLVDRTRGPAAPLGYVRLVLSQARLQRTQRTLLFSSIAVTGLLILVGITLTVLLTRRIVRPVRTLSEASLALAEGRMDASIDPVTHDEIGELARSFRTMVGRLKESREAVEQRTQELLAANARLQEEIGERRQAEESLWQRQQVLQSVYEMGTTQGQSFQSLFEQIAVHLAGFLRMPLVLVQKIEEGRARILAAARDGVMTEAEELEADDRTWPTIEEINALGLSEGHACEIRQVRPDPEGSGLAMLTAYPVRDSKGAMVGLITMADRNLHDLGEDDLHLIEIYGHYLAYAIEQRDLEVRLQAAQKTQVIAQLASGVAHEVRNPLNALLTLSEALFMDLGEDPEYKEFLIQIRVQVARLSALMQDLLELGKPIKPAQLRPEPLRPLCVQAIQMWREAHAGASQQVDLVLPPDGGPLAVLADNLRLQQVLINLLDNAVQHSTDGTRIRVVLDRPAPGIARIQVIDEGSGIPEPVLPHVFEPFYTTRKRGTGLGMSLVRHIVENHGGSVTIWNNTPEPGCTAEVRLPLSEAAGGPNVNP